MAWRNWRLQYSLRTLFLLTAVVACGLGWWYRHFEVEIIDDKPLMGWCPVGEIGPPPDPYRREVRTVRRSGWNNVVQDGPTIIYGRAGNRLEEQNWSWSVKQGIWRTWDADGKLLTDGAYDNGKEHGKWCDWERTSSLKYRHEKVYDHGEVVEESTYEGSKGDLAFRKQFSKGREIYDLTQAVGDFDGSGQNLRVRLETIYEYGEQICRAKATYWTWDWKINLGGYCELDGKVNGDCCEWFVNGKKHSQGAWKSGLRDGEWKLWDASGVLLAQMKFDAGHLVSLNGEAIANPFTRHPSFPDAKRNYFASVEFLQGWLYRLELNTILFKALCRILEKSEEAIHVDHKALQAAGISLEEPVTISIPQGYLKLAAMQEFFDRHHLTCVVRYGEYWVTTPKDAEEWKDPTGVYSITPEHGSKWRLYFEYKGTNAYNDSLTEIIVKHFDEQRMRDNSIVKVKLDRAAFAAANRNPDEETIRYVPQENSTQDALGGLLYLSDCCCALDGDVLVIRPQPSKNASPSP